MISRYHQVPLPDVLGDDSTGGPVPQVTVFFNMNMRLFYILGDILGTVYGPGRGARTDDGINGDISKDIEAIETSLSYQRYLKHSGGETPVDTDRGSSKFCDKRTYCVLGLYGT